MATERTVKLIAKLQDGISGGLRTLGHAAMGAATAIAGITTAVLAAAKKLSDYGAQIYDTATALNITAEEAQALGYVADQTGSSLGGLTGSIRAMNTLMRQGAVEGSDQAKALEQLGLSVEGLMAMSPADAFLTITDRIGQMSDEMEQNVTASTIFGNRYGTQVIAALNQTDGSMRNLMDTFNESGRAMSGEQIDALKKYSDAMTDLDYKMQSILADALVPLLPKLETMTADFAELASDVMPKLIPIVERAIQIMMDNLPTVIKYLGMAADGWAGISDGIRGVVGGDPAAALLESLTDAVRSGAMSVEEASDEWERYTKVTRTWSEQIRRDMIMPLDGLVTGIDNATAAHGFLRQEQVLVNAEMDNAARAAIAAAAGINAVTQAAAGSAGQIQALGGMYVGLGAALAEIAALAETGAGGVDDPPIAGMGTSAKRERAKEEILEGLKTIVEEALRLEAERYAEAKARAVDYADLQRMLMEEEAGLRKQEQTARMEAEQQRIQMIAQGTASLFTGIALAATQGQDALDAWFDQFKQRLLELTISSAFQALLGVLTPGGFLGGIFGGLFGRAGGGVVPGAIGGRVVGGSPGLQGDKVPMLLEPGELVLSRNQRRDMARAGSGGGVSITVDYRPILSTASRAEIGRLGIEVRNALRKVGVDI